MRRKLAILGMVLAVMCLAPFGTAQAQKNKKNKNQAVVQEQEVIPALAAGDKIFYVTIRGVKQGVLKGQSTNRQRQNQIQAFQFLMQLAAPRDASTGQASGKRQYSPITITKEWDACSPQIFEAASTNETLSLVEVDFLRTSPDGKESVYETIKLTDATISSVKRYIGFLDAGEPPDSRQLEDVSFSFSKIEITHSDGGTMFIDNWNSQL